MLYSIYSYYKILIIFPVLSNMSLQLTYYTHSGLYPLLPYSNLIPPSALPTRKHQFVLCESVSFLLYSLFCVFFRFHIYIQTHTHHIFFIHHLSIDTQVATILGNCKQCLCAIGVHVLCSNQCFHFFQVNIQEWNYWITWKLYFQFFEKPPHCFPQCPHQLTVLPTKVTFSPHFCIPMF